MYALGGGDGADSSMMEDMDLLGIQDASAADEFSKIALGMQILPSQKGEGNLEVMKFMSGSSDHEDEYDGSVLGAVTENYYVNDQTEDLFPEIVFNENTVPLGNIRQNCIHLNWSTKAQKSIIDRYIHVKGLPTCKAVTNPKVRWQKWDPTTGIEFRPWIQNKTPAGSAEQCPEDTVFVKSANGKKDGNCYGYTVADAICILVDFSINVEQASYDWEFVGGCFPDNKVVHYTTAKVGMEYDFDKMPIVVREYKKSLAERLGFSFSLSGLFSLISVLCLIGALAVGVMVTVDLFKKKEDKKQGSVEMAANSKNNKFQQFDDTM